MDILDQHLEQEDVSSVNPKVEVGTGIVIEESDIVDCDDGAYDPLSGDPQVDDGLRYQETLAYRVVQVNGNSSTSEIELPVTHQSTNAVQVLTTPINGQFYVIGNANDVFTTSPSRSLAPRATTLQLESPRSLQPSVKKRDDRRRATHNEVERRRRDKINNWIAKLGKIIPECSSTTNSNGNGNSSGEGKVNYETQSKGGILAKACDYINELKATNQNLNQYLRENDNLRDEVAILKQQIEKLSQENAALRAGNVTVEMES